jgi:hypothetical protein
MKPGIRESIAIWRAARSGIEAQRIVEQRCALDAAARKANATPEQIAQALATLDEVVSYLQRDYIAAEAGLDVRLWDAVNRVHAALVEAGNA